VYQKRARRTWHPDCGHFRHYPAGTGICRAVLVILLADDLVAVTVYRREASWYHLGRLFPWAALGIMLGAFTMRRLDEPLLRDSIGDIMVLLLLFPISDWEHLCQ
jgi:uncharacterized membrane protein YfcA